MKPISLTGIKPTGTPHIGNYLGMIQPALELVKDYQAIYFIADYHALTSMKNRQQMTTYVHQVAATWLALGLDPDEVVFYRQSDVPEVFELTWILDCFTAKGLLNRAHAYKAAVDANQEVGNNPDEGINAGLYNYPVLMAADILLFKTDIVPVGSDQRQHIEVARDIASAFNAVYGDVLVLPQALIKEEVAVIPGLDGRKMSKSYGNTIDVFAPSDQLRKQIMRIVTDSKHPEDPKNPDTCNLYAIYKHVANPERLQDVRQGYLEGGLAYGALKQELFELLNARFDAAKAAYQTYLAHTSHLDAVLQEGAVKARTLAQTMMRDVREAIGVGISVPA